MTKLNAIFSTTVDELDKETKTLNMTKIILTTLAVILSIISLLLLAITITMVIEELGHTMGNEAYGYFSTALLLTLLFSIPTVILWIYIYKQNKLRQISTNSETTKQ